MDADSYPDGLSTEVVTVDQVVALNLRYWRRAAGLTQEELGQRLGWSAANVSAAERSVAEGRDRRRFDAQTLAELAIALGVPLAALLLPPEDDGKRYTFTACGAERTMDDLMELVIMPDSENETPILEQYRGRVNAAALRAVGNRGPQWRRLVRRWTAGSSARRAREVAELRGASEGALRAARKLGEYADEIESPQS